ncbi:MAG: helix-turn-helix domain-containing protein, partial [Paludibacteraceae bacterium]
MNLQKLSIGEFSRLCGVTVKTLRHYEKIGLLKAEQTDRYTGYRYYSVGQLQKMLAIRQLKELGFSLEDIASLFRGSSHFPDAEMLALKIRETQDQMLVLNNRQMRLQALLDSRKNQETMQKISIQSLPAMTVASYKGILPSYSELGKLCCEV